MTYRKAYLLSHDIDWFCRINNIWICCASFGGLLPTFSDDEIMLPYLQAICSNLPYVIDADDITYGEDLLEERYKRHQLKYSSIEKFAKGNEHEIPEIDSFETFRSNYISSFTEMAKRGFYAYARVNIDELDSTYHLIAKPTDDASNELANTIDYFVASPIVSQQFKGYISNISINREVKLEFDKALTLF
jgi:hypothetical protein